MTTAGQARTIAPGPALARKLQGRTRGGSAVGLAGKVCVPDGIGGRCRGGSDLLF